MTPLIGGTLWGSYVEVKKVDITSHMAGRISKIKFLVSYRFFSNGYKKNLPLGSFRGRRMGDPGNEDGPLEEDAASFQRPDCKELQRFLM